MTSHETNEAGDVRGSLRDLLAAVLEDEIEGDWEDRWFREEYATHLADVQAAAVDGWLSGQVDRVLVTIGLLDDCTHPTSRGVCPGCTADAALAAIREQIGEVGK